MGFDARTTRIGGFAAALEAVRSGDHTIALWRVADLEQHVDRAALLRDADGPEPPYWAHLWSGALVLAAAVPPDAGRVLELGCGLGLPGLVAAQRGARVTFVDRVPAALAFVRASAATNGLDRITCVAADAIAPALRAPFDLVLAAELLYDQTTLAALAAALVGYLAPAGCVLLSDAGRTDTRAFYAALDRLGVGWRARARVVREEGLAVTVRLIEVGRPGDRLAGPDGRG